MTEASGEGPAMLAPGFFYRYRVRADGSSHFPYASDGVWALCGCRPDEILDDATPVLARFRCDDLSSFLRRVARSARNPEPWCEEYRIDSRDRGQIWVRNHANPTREDDGTVTWHGYLYDVTPEREAKSFARRTAAAFALSHEGVLFTDHANRIVDLNGAAESITGFTRSELVGRNPKCLGSGRHDAQFFAEMKQALAEHGQWQGELWNRRKTGEIYPVRAAIGVVPDDAGKPQAHVAVFSDVSLLKKHAIALDRAANFDALTGLPNRNLLDDRLRMAMARSDRSGRPMAVCHLDLDDFGALSDALGDIGGDAVLLRVADALRQAVRAEDTICRLGGDDFALVLADLSGVEECEAILDRILAALPATVPEHRVGASVGVALYPADRSDAESLLRHADQAMLRAKRDGKNRYHLFDPEFDRRVRRQRQTLDECRHAIAAGELRLFYQPKVSLADGTVVGAEALLRWMHPQFGLQAPAMFLPLVEGTEVDVPLGEWVLREAFRQSVAWRAAGIELPVSVNVSTAHLQGQRLLDLLREQKARHPGLPSGAIELEVLETTATSQVDHVARVIEECRRLGFRAALDDFGTGQSSLTHLRRIPTDLLKIDQSFIRNILDDERDRAIVEGVIRFALAFGREVVAEGVETVAVGDALRALGCRIAQGYGIARPMPPERIPDWIAAWRPPDSWTAPGLSTALS